MVNKGDTASLVLAAGGGGVQGTGPGGVNGQPGDYVHIVEGESMSAQALV